MIYLLAGVAAGGALDAARQRLIEFSVIGAAFVIVFFTLITFIWWVLRTSAREVREARSELANANQARAHATGAMMRVNTRLIDRMDRVIEMQGSTLGILRGITREAGYVAEDNPADGSKRRDSTRIIQQGGAEDRAEDIRPGEGD